MDVYDPTADSWSSIASMEARRRYLVRICSVPEIMSDFMPFDQHSWGGGPE